MTRHAGVLQRPSVLAIRDTAIFIIALTSVVACLIWGAWNIDFALRPTTLTRIVAVLILVGFALFFALLVTLVSLERFTHYSSEEPSSLHPPMILSTMALTAYFGIASISAIDVFYDPSHTWPLVRDPTVRLVTTSLILAVVAGKAWLLYEILPDARAWFMCTCLQHTEE